jgi:hypothetical protein
MEEFVLSTLDKATSLFFSVLRPRAGRFYTTKVAKQTKANLHKIHLFIKFSFNCGRKWKGLVMFSIILAIILYLFSWFSISVVYK